MAADLDFCIPVVYRARDTRRQITFQETFLVEMLADGLVVMVKVNCLRAEILQRTRWEP